MKYWCSLLANECLWRLPTDHSLTPANYCPLTPAHFCPLTAIKPTYACPLTSTDSHWSLPTFACPLTPTDAHLCPLMPTDAHWRPLTPTDAHWHPLTQWRPLMPIYTHLLTIWPKDPTELPMLTVGHWLPLMPYSNCCPVCPRTPAHCCPLTAIKPTDARPQWLRGVKGGHEKVEVGTTEAQEGVKVGPKDASMELRGQSGTWGGQRGTWWGRGANWGDWRVI